jgi:uncharacterized protein (TIGR03083 family)
VTRPQEQLYDDTRRRIVDLVEAASADQIEATVPATPAWRVRDIVAHVTGVCADVINGNLDGITTEAWTDAQVAARRDHSLSDVIDEWADVGPKFAAMLDDLPGHYGPQAVFDLTTHEQDLRGALNQPGARDSAALQQSVDFIVTVLVDAGANALGLGPIEVVAGDRTWLVGTAHSTGNPEEALGNAILTGATPAASTSQPAIRLETSPFELFRACTGRRSVGQVRRLGWSDDPEPYLDLFGLGPFTTRSADLEE